VSECVSGSKPREGGDAVVNTVVSKVNLVDLAGSEVMVACVRVYVCMCVCVYVCMCVCVYVCVYVSMYVRM
jgi:hypothetical protein